MTQPMFIPKDTVEAEVRDKRGRVRRIYLFLAASNQEGERQRLRDLLEERRFLPVKIAPSEKEHDPKHPGFELLSRDHVVWMRLDLLQAIDEIDLEAEGAADSVAAGVRIDLDDGSSLEGGIRYLLPSDGRRVGDYLERLPAFFPVRTPDHLYLVRRDRVVSVLPVDEVKK